MPAGGWYLRAAALILVAVARPCKGGAESDRRLEYLKRHKRWPADWEHDYNSPVEMAETEARIMQITDADLRWNNWTHFVQQRILRNITANGYGFGRVPSGLLRKLYERVQSGLQSAGVEQDVPAVMHGEHPLFIPVGSGLEEEAAGIVQPILERWCGCNLTFSAVYGIRAYQAGSSLGCHLDHPATHVASAVLHIAHDTREAWPFRVKDVYGRWRTIAAMEPGDLFMYESAKLQHCRPSPLQGSYYASLFLHFRPAVWEYDWESVETGVPVHWLEGLPEPATQYTTDAYRNRTAARMRADRAERGPRWRDPRLEHEPFEVLPPDVLPALREELDAKARKELSERVRNLQDAVLAKTDARVSKIEAMMASQSASLVWRARALRGRVQRTVVARWGISGAKIAAILCGCLSVCGCVLLGIMECRVWRGRRKSAVRAHRKV